MTCGFAYRSSYRLRRTQPTVRCAYLPVSLHPTNGYRWYGNINPLSIAYALRLGLGPDLPWADEPSPGNLRLSAGRILTCLFAYSYRHYLFPPLHHPFQDDFDAVGTLPYPCLATCRDFGVRLEPREFSAQGHSTSELLRTL